MKPQQPSERYIEQVLVKKVTDSGGYCIKLLSNYITGLPDRLCLFPKAKLAFVELKAPGKQPRKSQIFMHNRLRSLGFEVRVIDSLQGVDKLITDYIQENA